MNDLLCLSHLRWQFVLQRPQHLMTRAARSRRVFFFEEPEFEERSDSTVRVRKDGNVFVATPIVPAGLDDTALVEAQRQALHLLCLSYGVKPEVLWFYTPMAVEFARDISSDVCVFDCMDELSNFKGANQRLVELEAELLEQVHVVFAGGRSLYFARRARHDNVHLFPSSVDARHFGRARLFLSDPADQAAIPHPRVGFCGVIDERLDIELTSAVADANPDVHFVFVGPTAKIDPADLPSAENIHWLGAKDYEELPTYLSGWDAALMPFALNDSTRYISPTKTPEYLAAGRSVASTSVPDVVAEYGDSGIVHFGDTPRAFSEAIRAALADDPVERLRIADRLLKGRSWDATWAAMDSLIAEARAQREAAVAPRKPVPAVAPLVPIDRARRS